MSLCACGCGKKIPKRRERYSKYIKGHYYKMKKTKEMTPLMLLKKKKHNLFKNKVFKHKYFILISLEREIAKITGHRKTVDYSDDILDYSKGTNFCKKYNNDDIKCVMCFENNINCPKKCPKEGLWFLKIFIIELE